MLNQSIYNALQERAAQNTLNKRRTLDRLDKADLRDLCNESENLCESIEYGLMHLGEMMSLLGYFAESKQDFSNVAMSNDNIKHIGGLIQANAYLLNALRETAELSEFYLAGGLQGEMKRSEAE